MTDVVLTAGTDSGTGEANRAAIQAALDNEADFGTITIPEGHWYVHFNLAPHIALEVNKSVHVQFTGGPGLCSLKFGPESPASQFYGFRLHPVDAKIRFSHGKLTGPDDPGPLDPEGAPTVYLKAVYADAFEVGKLELEDMHIAGGWYAGVDGNKNTQPGWWKWVFRNCDITARQQGVSMFCNVDTNTVSCNVFDTDFHDCGPVPANIYAQGAGAFCYFNPAISVHMERCNFARNYRWGIQHNSSGGSNQAPLYIRYQDCAWDDVRVCALLSDLGPAIIDNARAKFHYQGFQCRNNTEFRGGKIEALPFVAGPYDEAKPIAIQQYATDLPMRVDVLGTNFAECMAINAGGNGSRWNIRGIHATNANRLMNSVITNVPSMDVGVTVRDSTIDNQKSTVIAGIYARNGRWDVQRTDFLGTVLSAGILGDGNLIQANVNRNVFDLPGKNAIRDDAGEWEIGPNVYGVGTTSPGVVDKRIREVVA